MTLQVAVVGCGKMGLQHARAMALYGGADLVACADPDEKARERFRELFGSAVTGYVDLSSMVEHEQPDVVVIATTTRWHASLAIEALELGCHVVCEKPMAWSLTEADRMVAAAESAGRRLLVNNEYNVHPRTVAALREVNAGAIGDLITMEGRFKGLFAGGFDLAEGSPHLFSLAQLFAGAPRAVSARFVADGALAGPSDIFPGSQLKTLDGGWLLGERTFVGLELDRGVFMHAAFLGRPTTPSILLFGTEGAIFLPFGATPRPALVTTDPTDPLADWRPLEMAVPSFLAGAPEATGDADAIYTVLNSRATAIADASWVEWFEAGASGEHPLSAQQAIRSMEVIHGSYRSHLVEGGAWVPLPLAERAHGLESWVTAA
jgi:predicted dehydrogenase